MAPTLYKKHFVLALAALAGVGLAANEPMLQELSPFEATAPRVANPQPAGTFPMPVSALTFEPLVDVQARNLAEAQGDVSIRGGIFENTGFSLGAATLLDPQTGHYFAEIPAAPAMLTEPEIYTGVANALWGFNSGVGTIDYGWAPVDGNQLLTEAGIGTDDFNSQRLYGARLLSKGFTIDAELARSASDGTVEGGEHEFWRGSLRLQHQTGRAQTDLFLGYQDKYFQWPYLYAVRELHELVGSSGVESEDIQTQLYMLNHQREWDNGGSFEASAYYRKNEDDYEFDVADPGLFNPYQHETEAYGLAVQGTLPLQAETLRLHLAGTLLADAIESTSLTAGAFHSRTYTKLAAAPEWTLPGPGDWSTELLAGLTYDDSNRDAAEWSPLARIAFSRSESERAAQLYAEYSAASQLAGYTAIGSSPSGGLFRGNQSLSREVSRNIEVGASARQDRLSGQIAVFFRQDDDLVDWVFDPSGSSFASRAARNVDIDTTGVELLGSWAGEWLETTVSYTHLHKDEDYGADSEGLSSFYALNYPEHRATAAFIYRPVDALELRLDNEYRVQEDNPLRTDGDTAFLSHLGIFWELPALDDAWLQLDINNLWNTQFQEVPGVPGAAREITLRAGLRF